MERNNPNLVSKARRAAKRVGLQTRKSRRGLSLNNRGGFQLIDPASNWIIAGEHYDFTAEDVIEFCTDSNIADARREWARMFTSR